jgi:hypothetical protein
MIPTELRNEGILHALGIAPDLFAGDCPLYLLDVQDVPREKPTHCNAFCTLTAADAALRDYLIGANLWQCHGIAVVFDFAGIAEQTTDVRRMFLDVLVHELAHAVSMPLASVPDSEPLPSRRLSHQRNYQEFCTTTKVDRHGHDWRYIRDLSHLWVRSVLRGYVPDLNTLLSPWVYSLTPLVRYIEALQEEPIALLASSFVDIRAAEPPEAFMTLWKTDCERLTDDDNRS